MNILGLDIVNPGRIAGGFDWTIRPIREATQIPLDILGTGGVPYDLLYMLFNHDDQHKWRMRREYFFREADDQNDALRRYHNGESVLPHFSPKVALAVRLSALRTVWLIDCILEAQGVNRRRMRRKSARTVVAEGEG